MIIEIDDDCADQIVQQSLVNTYVDLCRDLKIYRKNKAHLHEEDAAVFDEVAQAIEVLGHWYFAHGEFDKAVKKARKVK